MKGFLTFICLLLVGCCVGIGMMAADTEMHAARWSRHIESAQFMEDVNEDIAQAHIYSERCLEAVRMLANENGLLCERESKLTIVVAQMEEENRALKASLSDAVGRLENQNKQINELIDQNQRLIWQIQQLERTLELIENRQPPTPDTVPPEIAALIQDVVLVSDVASIATTVLRILL